MNLAELIDDAIKAYDEYRCCCDLIEIEAQKHIDWDDSVSCEHLPSDGLCILATLPNACDAFGMSECVCPADLFFSSVGSKNMISPQEFKAISI